MFAYTIDKNGAVFFIPLENFFEKAYYVQS